MESRRRAILSAASSGELNRLKELLAKCDDGRGLANTARNVKDDDGAGVIHFAAAKGHLNVVEYLIEELGLDVNTKDEKGESPMLLATIGGNMNTVDYLLKKGADLKMANNVGYSPLHWAAKKGYTEILTRLLSRGADVNVLSDNGTPLREASGQPEAVKILLDHNANPNLVSSRLLTPLMGSIVSLLPQSLRCVELLLEAGADPNVGSYGETPLIAAANDGSTEIIKRLIQAGANPEVTNYLGLTPLEIAALIGNHHGVEILFPVTSRISGYIDWSASGVIAHVQSDQAKEQRKLKAKEKFHEAKLSGTDAFKKQDYFKAIVCYSQANNFDPYDTNVLSNRSMSWARVKEGQKALEDANECILLRPDWPKAYYRAGVAYNLLKRYSDAEKAFLAGLELSPNNQELKDAYRKAVEAQK
ncbi:hypothetical protein C5167_046580 [Papaver somniferum]|uniref:Uncharacterized protein n=1 Tax=Papaver somniferum TaxID=3469 RepID=A0A4Y7LGF6_PAPSO|nr:ankyrin-1-like [Papaver somniferum]XP_026423948.1 ankyrin-1-like [Papaver somniferum]XP_026423949.1 ankyrin-1-like [Papaver somniferum]RZC83792.1 hypothetical protein C5167_046580 [Papaver somniferum]